jgi:3'(2'), 5'-bisphosphate nucleotidase
VVVASRSHGGERLEQYLDTLGGIFPEVSRTPVGSSLKLCILAEGQADLYPRLGPTSEWDIAAAHAVLAAAGGDVWTVNGEPLRYNAKESFLNPEFFAVADGAFPWRERLPRVPAPQQ